MLKWNADGIVVNKPHTTPHHSKNHQRTQQNGQFFLCDSKSLFQVTSTERNLPHDIKKKGESWTILSAYIYTDMMRSQARRLSVGNGKKYPESKE